MTEYSCYSYALELGFTEEEARTLASSKAGKGQDATVLRRLATVKGLPSMKPKYPMPPVEPELSPDALRSTASPVTSTASSKTPTKRKRKAMAKPTKV